MSSINDIVQVQEVASPMTNLANSFGKTLRVRRKLTFSESSEKPKKGHDNILHEQNRNSSYGIEKNRLFKGNSKNINESPSLKCLMLQKIINSPVEKENSTICMDMIVSKPISSPTHSSPTLYNRHAKGCFSLEVHDSNSQDSGFFSVPSEDSNSLNRLIESQNVNEQKNLSLDMSFVSPPVVPVDAFINNAVSPGQLSQNLLPPDFKSLIDGDIFDQRSPVIKPIVRKINKFSTLTTRKSDSVLEDIKNTDDCVQKRKIINEFEYSSEISISSKRLKPNVDILMSFESQKQKNAIISINNSVSKKKTTLFDYGFCKNSASKFRSFSTSEATIKTAFEKEECASNLIGDFSQPFILPLLSFNPHIDLRSISPETLSHLLEGAYNDFIDSYLIIDCRYPYEYEGGHIRGAVNIYTKEHLLKDYTEDKLCKKSSKNDQIFGKRNVLIFHCEFSLERGPNLSRYLRNVDRKNNFMCYPYLDYPEIYLLDGGYCKFYSQYNRLCVPSSYRSMGDPDHAKDLRKFQFKAKTWSSNNDNGVLRITSKNALKRLGF